MATTVRSIVTITIALAVATSLATAAQAPRPAGTDPRVVAMRIDDPVVLAEVTAAFDRYEVALVTNEVAVLDELFWDSPTTLRYGPGENLYGTAEITAFRATRPSAGLARTVTKKVITTYGTSAATANIEFTRAGNPRIGRQSQTWIRMPEGWRIVAAHVSLMEAPPVK